MPGILEETLTRLKWMYGERFDEVTIEKVTAGIFMTMVQISTGSCGISVTGDGQRGLPYQAGKRNSGPFSPGQFYGQRISDLFRTTAESPLLEVIRLSVMNALSAEIILHSDYHVIVDADPVDLLDLDNAMRVVVVGAFRSYIQKFAESRHHLTVLELKKDALTPEQQKYFMPASRAESAMKQADIIFITGSTLANNTLDDLLTFAPQAATVVLVGPSSGLIPDVLFSRGVSLIGATRIVDPEKASRLISEGAAGYHLFQGCAQKICLIR